MVKLVRQVQIMTDFPEQPDVDAVMQELGIGHQSNVLAMIEVLQPDERRERENTDILINSGLPISTNANERQAFVVFTAEAVYLLRNDAHFGSLQPKRIVQTAMNIDRRAIRNFAIQRDTYSPNNLAVTFDFTWADEADYFFGLLASMHPGDGNYANFRYLASIGFCGLTAPFAIDSLTTVHVGTQVLRPARDAYRHRPGYAGLAAAMIEQAAMTKNISRSTLAAQVGISPKQLQELYEGGIELTAELAKRFADALGINAQMLLMLK
jgi:hypothetical protein